MLTILFTVFGIKLVPFLALLLAVRDFGQNVENQFFSHKIRIKNVKVQSCFAFKHIKEKKLCRNETNFLPN
jgi:hypothetical protein